jgi:hypothetical protein
MRFVWPVLIVGIAVLVSNLLKNRFGEGVRAGVVVVVIVGLFAGFAILRVVRGRMRVRLKELTRERWLTAQDMAKCSDEELASTIDELELAEEEKRRLVRAIERVRRRRRQD